MVKIQAKYFSYGQNLSQTFLKMGKIQTKAISETFGK